MAQKLLTDLGIKVTKQRKIIVEILKQNKEAITAEEIYQTINPEEGINFSTVYRTLGTLTDKGVLSRSGVPGGKVYFKLRTHEREHEHEHEVECIVCHEHIPIEACPVENFSRTLNEETGFVVTEHRVEIKGLCAKCAGRQKGV